MDLAVKRTGCSSRGPEWTIHIQGIHALFRPLQQQAHVVLRYARTKKHKYMQHTSSHVQQQWKEESSHFHVFKYTYTHTTHTQIKLETGEMTQGLASQSALSEDPGLIASTHVCDELCRQGQPSKG